MRTIPTKTGVVAALAIVASWLQQQGSCAPPEPPKVAVPPEPTDVSAKRYDIPAYSVQFPNIHMSKLTNWIKEGSTKVTNYGIELTDEETGFRGSFFNTILMATNTFDLEFEVDVRGPLEAKTADGFVVWFVSEQDYSNFLWSPSEEIWNLFGYKPNFSGFAAIFATADRINNPTSSISGLANNSTKIVDIIKDVPSTEGVYFNFRNGPSPLRVRIQFAPNQVKLHMRWANEKDWKSGFSSRMETGGVPARGYIGFSGSNRRLPKGETSLAQLPHQGDKITLSKVQVFTTDFDLANKQLTNAQEMYSNLMHRPASDPSVYVKMLGEMLTKFVIAKQEHIMSELNRIHADNRRITERMDVIQSFLTNGANDRQMNDAFDKLKMLVSENSRVSLQQIDQLRGGLNVDELSRHSVELKEVLKSHTARTQWMTVGVGSIVLISCGLFYKRMKDMEKKHIL